MRVRMLQHQSSIQVRYAETDMMGIVYHANYLPWFEIARTDLLKHHGLPYRDLEAEGFFLPVLEVSVRYLKSARYDDAITVIATMAEKPSLRLRITYEVRRGATAGGRGGEGGRQVMATRASCWQRVGLRTPSSTARGARCVRRRASWHG